MGEKISDVYFTDMRTTSSSNLFDKIRNLVLKGGFDKLDLEKKFTAIKIHFGEPGNFAYIRPNFVSVVSELVKERGGKVFLTDANTLYSGKRSNSIDHLSSAEKNGFSSVVTGCPVIIADGLKGTDYSEIEISLAHCKTAKIGTVIADSDVIISMSHFKGHDTTGFGGALKNIGMGSGSRGGKLEMHSSSKPFIIEKKCLSCGQCIKYCPVSAIEFGENKKAKIDYELCIGCGQCIAVCKYGAAALNWDEAASVVVKKIAEYTLAVLKEKQHFHITFVMDVSPNCDCWNHNDTPIVSNIGILASFDPVAIDQAAVDLVNKAPAVSGSQLDNTDYKPGRDKFTSLYPGTNWQEGLDYAQSIGLGNTKYNLVRV
ncbi:MAG: DUF362 domain-containing protein [Spirochaetia bacterium]|nr:DUF362 domain-containing protein [Spirochaetia bacterium]